MDYNVQIGESGEHFNETVEVDTEKQTELFKVPARGKVDHSDILHDFKSVSLTTIGRNMYTILFRWESRGQRCKLGVKSQSNITILTQIVKYHNDFSTYSKA